MIAKTGRRETWTRIESKALSSRPKVRSRKLRVKSPATPSSKTEGKTQQTAGKIQNDIGGLKDAVKEAVNK